METILANLQLRGATKNEEGSLDKDKGLRATKRASSALIGNIHFLHETPPSRLGEADVLSNVQKPTQRVKETEEIEKYVPNKRTRKNSRNRP